MRNIFTILLFLSLTLTVSKLHGQIFPVQATTQLSPPYSLYLSDYVASGSERLVLNLFLGDIQRPQLDVRFRLRIVGQNVTIETKPEYMPPPVSLHGGVPLRLMNTDLAHYFHPNNLNFQGITKQQYERMGKLPEGVYQFCFEVLEYNRGVKISNTACAVAWMVLNDPPIINLPRQDEKIRPQLPQNIVFQWTPRHTGSPNSAFTTEYTFEMVEVWPENRNPNDAILTSPKILEATTQTTTFIYGPSEVQLEPGRRYAFRIRAKAQSGIDELDLFKNQGYSEVYTFMYGDACGLPSDIVAQPLSSSRLKFGWDVLAKHSLFNVRYREAGTTDWYINESTLNETIVSSLKPATVYEYQVSGICGSVRGEFSDIATVKTPEAPPSEYTCGLPIQTFDLDPSQLTGSLKVGDIVNAGDFDVSLTKVTGSNGVFTGEGVVVMPMMNKAKVKVDFKSITVATDPTDGANRLVKGDMNVIGGELEIVPQGVLNAIEKLDEILDIADSALTVVESYLPREGPDPASFAADTLITFDAKIIAVVPNNETGKVYVTTSDGKVTELPSGGNVAVVDGKGKGYVVDKKGGVTKTTAEEAVKASKREYNFAIQFANAQSSKFGFDAYDGKNVQLAFTHENLNDTYHVPWKAASQTTGDVVEATLSDASLNPEHIRFEMIGLEATATLAGNDKWNIKIISSTHAAKIIAYYQQPGDEKEQILGKLNVSAFDQKDLNLVIVKDDNVNVNLETIGAKLNEIYGQAIANWKVSYESRDLGIDKNFDAGGTSVLTNYTADMRKVISNWGALQEDTYYMFVIDKPTNSGDVNAFMPRSRQAGFIYADGSSVDAYAHTIAHELGHGAFALRHPFLEFPGLQQNATNNLMDYTGVGNHHLMHFQWERIHDPVTVIGLFDEDEEATYEKGLDFQKLLQMLASAGVNTFVFGVRCESPLRDGYSLYLNGYRYYFLKHTIDEGKDRLEITQLDNSQFPAAELYSRIKVPEFVFPATLDKLLILNKEVNGAIIPFLCEVNEDYPNACGVEQLTDIKGFYSKIEKDISKCIFQKDIITKGGLALPAINHLLQNLQSAARDGQEFEFTQNGIVYSLNEQNQAEIKNEPFKDADINEGNWTGYTEMNMRIGFNADGIVQFTAIGIRKDLPLATGKTASLTEISANMLTKNNALLREYQVKSVEATPNTVGANLDSDAFPDGKKVAIDKDASFMKIFCEVGGIGLSFLKTSEIEQPVYFEAHANTIKAPPIATGAIESIGMVVTDLTSAAVMVHDIVTDEKARTQAKDGFVEIGNQIKSEPQSLFPILLDVVLEEFTGATSNNYEEMISDATNRGRKHHLTTKTAVRSATSIFTSGKILTQLPDMSMKVAAKMTKAKFFKRFDDLDDIADDVLKEFKDRLKKLPDGGEKFLDDFKDVTDAESLRKLVDNPDFVDNWKALDDTNVDESIRKNIDAVEDPDAVAEGIEAVGKAKPTWPEIQAFFKRGNDFNKKALRKYQYNEIVLKGVDGKAGKRLDSYIPKKEIISRKATTLTAIQPSTFEGYLKELITKYRKGTVINSSKLPPNTVLDGDYFLEIPTSNKDFFESSVEFQKILSDFNKTNKVDVKIKYLDE